MVNYDVHIKASKARRFQTKFHTGVYSIVDMTQSPPKLKVRLTQKLDFGPLLFLNATGKAQAFDPAEQAQHDQDYYNKMTRKRVVNGPTKNSYEKWLTAFMCSEDRNNGMLAVKITNANTRLANPDASTADELQASPLMKTRFGVTSQQRGIERKFTYCSAAPGAASGTWNLSYSLLSYVSSFNIFLQAF